MSEPVTLDHIRAIVDGVRGALDARFDGLQQQVEGGFKSTHARISEQAAHIHQLAGQVATTNGKVGTLRSDVDRLERQVGQELARSLREASEYRGFLHKRETDRADVPPVEHARTVDVINEQAPFNLAVVRKYWKVITGAIAGATYLGYMVGKWLERLGVLP